MTNGTNLEQATLAIDRAAALIPIVKMIHGGDYQYLKLLTLEIEAAQAFANEAQDEDTRRQYAEIGVAV